MTTIKRRTKKTSRERDVFVVHSYETADGYHHVTYGTFAERNPRVQTRRFKKWVVAGQFAVRQARKMGLESIKVDSPSINKRVKLADIVFKPQKKAPVSRHSVRLTPKTPRLR